VGESLLLVLPVGGHAVLGAPVHREGADLQLDRLAVRPDHRGVQRLVHVELGHRDVVLEPARDRVPSRVHRAQGGVAVADRVDEDADAHEVVDVGEVPTSHDHLLVDRVVVLGPSGDRGVDLGCAQVLLDLVDDPGQVLVAAGGALGDQPDDLVVHLGVERGERQVLQLPLDGVHPEPVSQRGVDLQRLAGLAVGGLPADVAPGAGVVQPVGQLDDQDPDVPAHGDDHLAHGLGLGGVAVLDLVKLGDPVHQASDLVAELGAQRLQRVVGVLDGVVQQGGSDGGRRHPELGEDAGHGQRVSDVGVPALALLTPVGALGDDVGLLDQRDISPRVVGPQRAQQRLEDRACAGSSRAQPGEPGSHPVRGAEVCGGIAGTGGRRDDCRRGHRGYGRSRGRDEPVRHLAGRLLDHVIGRLLGHHLTPTRLNSGSPDHPSVRRGARRVARPAELGPRS